MKRFARVILIICVLALLQIACNFPTALNRKDRFTASATPPVSGSPTATLPPVITATSNPAPTQAQASPTQAAPTATAKPTATSGGGTSGGACTYRATFVADVSVPDDSLMQPGSKFVKTWRVRNDGTCTWGPGADLHAIAYTGGNQLGARSTVELPLEVKPGQWVDVSVSMTAPNDPGSYTSNWMFLRSGGSYVGLGAQGDQPLYARIQVSRAFTRVNFASGATTKVIEDSLGANEARGYVLGAQKDQVIIAQLSSAASGVKVKITTTTGAALQGSSGQDGKYAMAALPSTQDYVVWVSTGSQAANFSLSVTIPARIQFASGATSASVNGSVGNRLQVSYILWAKAGQTMTVELVGNNVGLTIYGLADGQPLVRAESGATTWTGKLPASQDYIIAVVPAVDSLTFTMKVTIK